MIDLRALAVARQSYLPMQDRHRHIAERAYPTGRYRTRCGRVFHGDAAPRDELPITCTICLRKGDLP